MLLNDNVYNVIRMQHEKLLMSCSAETRSKDVQAVLYEGYME
jgi:hypothetical protein